MAANSGKVLGAMVAVWAVLAGLAALQGGFFFGKHETDMLHLMDIVLRRAAGEVPHLDYMTPLGIWASEPMALLHRAGLGLGQALIWGQVLVAALVLPGAWWVAASRMRTGLGIAFGASVLLLVGAVVFGGTDTKPSLSMHYNRWAWAIAFLPLALVALPARRDNALADGLADRLADGLADGLVIGLAMAALALIKATYFAAFAPAVVLGLVMRGQVRALGIAVLAGAAVALAMTVVFGVGFWGAYLGDLLDVARSTVRPAPGAGWAQVVLAPDYAAGTLAALGSVLWLRRADRGDPVGLILAVMLPGAIYVTWQNYGNDPLWLILWAFVMAARWQETRAGVAALIAAVALALVAPVALNIAVSPLRQVTLPRAVFAPVFPGIEGRADVHGVSARMEDVRVTAVQGAPEVCKLASGAVGWMRAMARDLKAAGLGKEPVYVADLFNFLWLFGDTPRLREGAPWYYGGWPGYDAAALLVVPKCPLDPDVRDHVIASRRFKEVQDRLVFESGLMRVYRLR